jgi:hypothetical protein
VDRTICDRAELAKRLRAEALMHYQITEPTAPRDYDLLSSDARWQAAELLEAEERDEDEDRAADAQLPKPSRH